jgi:hypothetical protein
MAMRLTVIVVPVLQWAATAVLGLGLAVAWAFARGGSCDKDNGNSEC